MDIRVAKKYRLGRCIGSGSFGNVFIGIDTKTGGEVAIKLVQLNQSCRQEPIGCKKSYLLHESRVYKKIAGGEGVPKLMWYGTEGDFNVMVMELLGPSLQELFAYSGHTFDLHTILLLAQQMLKRVRHLHQAQYLHRDLKPENFTIGHHEKEGTLYLIDYGLAKSYVSTETGQHIPFTTHSKFVGAMRYASLNAHMRREQGRRDDLEAIGYIVVYLFKKCLPWQLVAPLKGEEMEAAVRRKKSEVSLAELCKELPGEVKTYMEYCKALQFESTPDYDYLIGLFEKLQRKREGDAYNTTLDWKLLKQKMRKKVAQKKLAADDKPVKPAAA